MQRRYLDGETLQDIAEDAGVSSQTIGRRLEKAGIHLRGHMKTEATRQKMSEARRMNLPEDKLRELHSQEMSTREMAAILGCNEETVRERLIEMDLPRLPAKARPGKNHFWQGGYAVDEDGYILKHCPDHPHATKAGYVRQHRLVMEKVLGRYLTPEEVVDHRNRDTSDNRPENLQVFPSNADHLRDNMKGLKKVSPEEREHLKQEARRRAHQRIAAILAESGNDSGP